MAAPRWRCPPRNRRFAESQSATTAKAFRPTTGRKSSTASSPRGATAAAPEWGSPSCAPCWTPMAERSASQFRAGHRVRTDEPVAESGVVTIARICCAPRHRWRSRFRRYWPRLGLPAFIVKYGGSALWGAMVFFLSRWPPAPVAAWHRADRRLDRDGRGAVWACPYARARRLSADPGGRAAARPHLLSLGYSSLWRGDRIGDGARSSRSPGLSQQCAAQPSIKSLTRLFGRGGFSAFIAWLAASSAMRMISFIRAVIFSRIDFVGGVHVASELRFVHQPIRRRPVHRRVLIPQAGTAGTGATRPRCGVSAPCARPFSHPRRPSSDFCSRN